MKKDVYLRLFKRVAGATLLALILTLAGGLYLESRWLEQLLLDRATAESVVFQHLYQTLQENPAAEPELRQPALASLEASSYLLVSLRRSEGEELLGLSVPPGDRISTAFDLEGRRLIPSDRLEAVRMFRDKRLYYKLSIPIKAAGGTALTGRFNGIYRVSLEDAAAMLRRLLTTAAVGAAAVLLCGIFCAVAFMLLNRRIIRTAGRLLEADTFLLKSLGTALAKSDTGQPAHNHRVLIYSAALAKEAGLDRLRIRELLLGGLLHDLGMLPVPASELLQETLGETALQQVRQHPRQGRAAIGKIGWLKAAAPVIGNHHEKYDGSGYPAGLKHEKIPETARVFAIADAFDALTSTRPYRTTLPLHEALKIMEQQSGLHFDPVLLSAFTRIAPELYRELAARGPRQLEKRLDKLLAAYLQHPAGT